jgi:hypothetical protein
MVVAPERMTPDENHIWNHELPKQKRIFGELSSEISESESSWTKRDD